MFQVRKEERKENIQELLEKVKLLVSKKLYSEAEALIQTVSLKNPDEPEACYLLGEIYLSQKNFNKLFFSFKKHFQRIPFIKKLAFL